MFSSVTIFNDTVYAINFCDTIRSGCAYIYKIPAGEKITLRVPCAQTHETFSVRSSLDNFSSQAFCFTSDEISEVEEMRIYSKPDEYTLFYACKGRRRHSKSFFYQDFAAFESAKKRVSSRLLAVLKSCVKLEELLNAVKICRNQCSHLVQSYKEGILNMTKLYFSMAVYPTKVLDLYNSGKLKQVYSCLNRLEYSLCSAEEFLRSCGDEWTRIALVVSILSPPPEMKVYSKFDLLMDELTWNLDILDYILCHGPEMAVNSEDISVHVRTILQRMYESRNVVAEAGPVPPDADSRLDSRGHDRQDLLSRLENGSIFIPKTFFPRLGAQLSDLLFGPKKLDVDVTETVTSRCKADSVYPSIYKVEPGIDAKLPDFFWIRHSDLKLRNKKSSGAFKSLYEGEWLGQKVTIATMKNVSKEGLETEAVALLRVQHAKIVDFFGCAYTDDAPPPVKEDAAVKCTGGYLVMELMQEALRPLIERTRLNETKRRDSGGPFSLSVGLDILSQIVEAMLHLQKYHVIHRDLRAANCLVNPRPSPMSMNESDWDLYYDVKLIDFGTSKISVSNDENTLNVGSTRWMAPEVRDANGTQDRCSYNQSADVYSFGMTCYEVITGLLPFELPHGKLCGLRLRERMSTGEAPSFPASISIPDNLKKLIADCWVNESATRPSFEKIQERLWTIRYELELLL